MFKVIVQSTVRFGRLFHFLPIIKFQFFSMTFNPLVTLIFSKCETCTLLFKYIEIFCEHFGLFKPIWFNFDPSETKIFKKKRKFVFLIFWWETDKLSIVFF